MCSVYRHSLSAEQGLRHLVWLLGKCSWRNKWSRFLQRFLKYVGGLGSIDCHLPFIKLPSCETQKVLEASSRTSVLGGVLCSFWKVPCYWWPWLWQRDWLAVYLLCPFLHRHMPDSTCLSPWQLGMSRWLTLSGSKQEWRVTCKPPS